MRVQTTALMALLITVGFCGCGGDSHERVTDDMIREMKKFVAVMEDVKTVEDAKAVKPKVEKIGKRMKAIVQRAKKMDDPSPEVQKRIDEKMEEFKAEMMPKMIAIGLKMTDPEIAKELGAAMKDIDFK